MIREGSARSLSERLTSAAEVLATANDRPASGRVIRPDDARARSDARRSGFSLAYKAAEMGFRGSGTYGGFPGSCHCGLLDTGGRPQGRPGARICRISARGPASRTGKLAKDFSVVQDAEGP